MFCATAESLARNPRRWRGFCYAALIAAPLCSGAAAAPYVPDDDQQIIERLPADPPQRAPTQRSLPLPLAVRAAQVYIERGRQSGDPRQWGYARGLLGPWWQSTDPPDDVLLLRATLAQAHHDFAGALQDLERLLSRHPGHVQARLTRATVHRVQGRHAAALGDCLALRGRASVFVSELCVQGARGLAGHLASAAQALDALMPSLEAQAPDLAAWYCAERADLAERAADPAGAERWYREGLKRSPADIGLRSAYADLLIALQRPAEALQLVVQDAPVDALMLRQAIALRQLQDSRWQAVAARLRDSFDAARRRGDTPHLREEARFLLQLGTNDALALRRALENWRIQREPWDARLVLIAARAAGQADAAQGVRDWLPQSGLQDARLEQGL